MESGRQRKRDYPHSLAAFRCSPLRRTIYEPARVNTEGERNDSLGNKVDSRMLCAAGWFKVGKWVNWRPYYHGKPKIERIIKEKSNGKAYLGKLTTWQFCRCLWETGSHCDLHCDRPPRETALRDDPFCCAGTWDMRKLGKVTWSEGVPCRHLVFPSIFVCFP